MSEQSYLRPIDMNPAMGDAPAAVQRDHQKTHHGVTWNDPYSWLRDPDYPEVEDEDILAYLSDENTYFEKAFEPHQKLVESLFREIRARIKEDDASVPVKDGDWYFQTRYAAGEEYPRHYRRHVAGGEWELILDEPKLAEGLDYLEVGGMDVTDDGSLVAYSVDDEGNERFRMRFERLPDHTQLPEEIPNTIDDPTWLPDNRTVLYSEVSDEWRPYRIRLHTIGTDPTDDPIIYEEEDTGFFVSVDLSQDRRYIILATSDHVTSEVRVIPATDPRAEPIVVSPRRVRHEYDVDHAGGSFYIRTNDLHRNFRIVRAGAGPGTNAEPTPLRAGSLGEDTWVEVVSPSDEVYIRGYSAFSKFLALEERVSAVDAIRIMSYEGESHVVAFPESAFAADLGENAEEDVDTIQIHYESMVTPPTVFDYHVADRHLVTRKVQQIPSGYDSTAYVTERLMAPAADGESIPISVVYHKGFPRDGSGFLHLYAYGAYGVGTSPSFSISQLSLLDRGFAFAIAHIRGGDEMGYRWYEGGKLFKRKNTFTDFVEAARYLCKQGYTAPGRICASGGSAGGELMGAAINMAGDLFRAVVTDVPFVDVLNTMLDDSLPLTPTEWPEWGNPIESKEAFDYIRSYSPYDNVEQKHYPPLLVTAGLNDPRVTYWEPAKWTARLRATKTDTNVLLLKTNMEAGHAGKSGRFAHLRETAEYMVFFLLATRQPDQE